MSNVQAKIDILAAKLQKSQALDKELSATGSSKVFAGCISALIILAACIAALLAAGGFPVALLDLAGFDGITTGNIMGLVGVGGRIDQTTRDILEVIEEMQRDESGVEALEVARQLVASSSDAQKTVEAIRNEIALMAQELEDRDQQLETGDKNSCNLEAALASSKKKLAAMETALEEQRRVADLASRVKVPPGAPRIQGWYVEREVMVLRACDRLGIGRIASDSLEKPRMVGLAGPSGAGKSTVASLVIDREDVRASFHNGVLWLQVGQGGVNRLSELMNRLAGMIYTTVMLKECRPPRKAGIESNPEEGAAYIREVLNDRSRRFLVVADDVWEVEVLRELEKAELWVLYTTRQDRLLPDAPSLRLDQLLPEEAEMVLRRAAELDDDARLPQAAHELMDRSEYAVLDLALVGRWSDVRERRDNAAWQTALDRIVETQQRSEGDQPLSWRASVLRAGLEELACDNPKNKELYLSLAVIPKGLNFPSEVAAAMLYGGDFSAEDLKAAEAIVATLERWSILTLEDGGMYRVHDEHADFVKERISTHQDVSDRALPRWQAFMRSGQGLVAFSSECLVKLWDEPSLVKAEDALSRPYDTVLDIMHPSSIDRIYALRKVAHFYWLREDWSGAYEKNFELLTIEESTIGTDHPDLASTLHNLGEWATKMRSLEEAEKFHRRALTIRVEHLGIDHPDVASSLMQLGVCARDTGRTAEAEERFQQALAINEKQLGTDHAEVARSLRCLGMSAMEAGRSEEAEEFYRRALTIDANVCPLHESMASTLHNLGSLATEAGRTVEAERYFQESLDVREETVEDPLKMALTLTCLGVSMEKAKRFEEAEEIYGRVLSIRKMKLGIDHPDVAGTLYSLGGNAHGAGRTMEAEEYFRQALEIGKKQLGVDHPDVASTLFGLGQSARKVQRKVEAEEYFRRALTIQEKELGFDHLDVADTLFFLGDCVFGAGRIREAEEILGRELSIREGKQGIDHADVADTLHGLGMCACRTRRFGRIRITEGEKHLQRALAIREKQLDIDHRGVAFILHALGYCNWKAGRTAKAEEFHQRELVIRKEILGADHTDVADTLHWLAVNIGDAGRIEEAEQLFQRALAIREGKLGFHHPDTAITRKALVELGSSTTTMIVIKTAAAILACIFSTVCCCGNQCLFHRVDNIFRRSANR